MKLVEWAETSNIKHPEHRLEASCDMQESIPGTEESDDSIKTCEQGIESKPKEGNSETNGVSIRKIKNKGKGSTALEDRKAENIKKTISY